MLDGIRGEATFDFLADCIEPIVNIAMDEEASAFFKRETPPEGEEPRRFFLRRVKESVPTLMRGHKADLMAIMAAAKQETVEEYAKHLTPMTLMADLVTLLTDEEFGAFLS